MSSAGALSKEYILFSCGEFEVETVFHLDLSKRQLPRMSGLQICKNLERVNLSRNGIIRIESVDSLPNLRVLDLSHNKLSKVGGFGRAPIETLRLQGNPISRNCDVSDLCDLKTLR